MKRVIFATGNENKMREVREILAELPVEILSMKEAGISSDPDENGETFEENALIKAKAVAAVLPEQLKDSVVLADDSGLEVDAMDKMPGVQSARWMGHDTSYRIKNAKIIENLEGVPVEKRTARFVDAIAAVLPDGRDLVVRGVIEGKIGYEEKGENGFGYDPIFMLPDMSRSTAELSPEEKNEISHRGKALRQIAEKLREVLA
ncbi:MAG: RdgB/HAM1 family non-canonical purine NTP pyrophosphatase [Eubacterium sp.]|uniref:dITP/XTP pyrophosphatase n=1 Tax=Eubacterium cellulosolvens (strain ATCC 43171 / JCM 9499 / 6) TaxID=633697 RepID=I5AW03_EUBC6|nr:RdgB/HAM1 family non-canonical purine NTP pyrophosphatase [Eubacterium sp.]